jgi:citrate synthase
MTTFWKTSLSEVSRNRILIRGYRIEELMDRCSFGDMIYLSFTGELPGGHEGRILEAIVVSSTEHSVLAPSINTTRFVASSGVPLQASVAAGLLSLGDHHGGAIEACAQLLQRSVPAGTPAGDIVAQYKADGPRIPGFGHPWHDRDPRPLKLGSLATEWGLAGRHLSLAHDVADRLGKPMNIDGAIAGIISDIGIDWRYGKAFFMISRTVGLAAHHVEETTRERPFRAVSPEDVTYDGPPERDIPESFGRRNG